MDIFIDLIRFIPKDLILIQTGGSNNSKNNNKKNNDKKNNDNKNNDNKNNDNKLEDDEPTPLLEMIMDTIKTYYKNVSGFLMGWVLGPIIFASFAPAMPFLLVMAGMFAILKYIMGFFRKL